MVQRIDLLNPPDDPEPPDDLAKECPRCGREWARVKRLHGRADSYFHPSGWLLRCNVCHTDYRATDPMKRPSTLWENLKAFVFGED